MGTMRGKVASIDSAVRPKNTSFVASAAMLKHEGYHLSTSKTKQAWQAEAYEMYRQVGEFRYAADWVGSMMSKAVLFPTYRKKAGKHDPVVEGPARELLDDLCNDADGRAEMLRLIGIHFVISGECFLVGYDNPDPYGDEDQIWKVVAPTRISQMGNGGKYRVDEEEIPVDPADVLVIRLWKPDPTDSRLAFSPACALLPVLGEILRLTQHVAAQVDSRLAGAGILMVPSDMTFPEPPMQRDAQGNEVQHQHYNDAESLMRVLNEAMSAAIRDRANPSALVPIVITAPSEAISAARHMTFWSELDAQAIELRTEAIRRLALGLDMPPEILQGAADANHWSAWQADESAIKAHTEPLLKIITSGISKGYLRPLLRHGTESAEGVEWEELRKYSVAADTSDMRLRPDRSKEALELYQNGEISGETLRRETGFTEDDAMSKSEMAQWFRKRVAGGSTTPQLVERALQDLGVFGEGSVVEESEETQEGRPQPSLKDHPSRDIPDREESQRRAENRAEREAPLVASLAPACDQLAIRAFERAGNKLKNRMSTKPLAPAHQLHESMKVEGADADFLLEDAWSHLPEVAQRNHLTEESLQAAMDSYVRDSLVTAQPHTYERMSDHLQRHLEGTK